ncbi:MAG TPA: N-acetylmuramoyl-L-alanine amidase [Dehalococcoidia bacterium]|nr:N-acetylmuramoyl-L-alanine amidase [Dehalococcoidia bacterium]
MRWLVPLAALLGLVMACGSDPPFVPTPAADRDGSSAPIPFSDSRQPFDPGMLASPASDKSSALPPLVVLDPGHGGAEIGSAEHGLVEKNSNVEMARRVARLLETQGIRVLLTRDSDARAASPPEGVSAFAATRFDLQARVDMANAAGAAAFVSIHSNGSPDAGQRGLEVWYDSLRPFASRNLRLAELLLRNTLSELALAGYQIPNRGLQDDTCFRNFSGRCFQLFVLGPEREVRREELIARGRDPKDFGLAPGQDFIRTRATQMPAALIELLFITNSQDAAILKLEAARDAMARGIAKAVLDFLAEGYSR